MNSPLGPTRRRWKPRIVVPAALCVAGALAAGCSSSSSSSSSAAAAAAASSAGASGQTVNLQLWESHSGSTNPVAVTEQEIVNKFNASQAGVHVSILETKASTKGLAAAQAGHPPVIAEISHYDGQFRNAGLITDQTSLMNGSGGFTSSQLSSFYPGVLANGRIPQKVINGVAQPGKQYRIAADVKVEELFYNTALFQQAGISACPGTWTALGQDLVRLKALGVTPMGFKDASAHIESAFIANGGSLTKPGSGGTLTAYDTAAGTTTFNQFRQWYSQKLFIFSHGASMRADLASKKLAIEDGTSAGWAKVRDAAKAAGAQVRACPFPSGTSGHSGNIIQGLGFVIFSHASAAQQQAAFTFEKFWNSPSIQAFWAKGSGFDPSVASAVPLIGQSYLNSGAGVGLNVSIKELASPYSQPRGQSDNYAQVDSALDSAFFNAVTGKQSVPAALAGLDKAAAGYLKGSTKI
jgi:ABC-type glycerol-3-phosphate transport system substrate-binding protein